MSDDPSRSTSASGRRPTPSSPTAARESWANDEMVWGVGTRRWTRVLGDVDGLDVVELGCGTAFFAARSRGGAPVPSASIRLRRNSTTARRMHAEIGLEFPLVEAPAEAVPLADSSFDLVLSEYGASLWADPTNGFRRPRACSVREAGSSF